MTDRNSEVRSTTFKVPFPMNLKDLKTGVQKEVDSAITVRWRVPARVFE